MSDLLAFAERHPWWTLFYLIIAAGALQGLVRITVNRSKS